MAEYNPGQILMQIGEQLGKFEDRVIVIVNAAQQLHHRRLAIDLLRSEQMAILHLAVQEKSQEVGFNALATKTKDYYQMETTCVRNDNNDIIIILCIPGIIEIDLITIYRYLPFPILPKVHNLTVIRF
jgi:hypothetical protein